MSLATYASRVAGLIDELGQGWPEEDLRAATEALHAMGLARWEEWRGERADAVHALLAATPARRAALLRGSDEPVLLKVAAMQALAEAAALLRTAAELDGRSGIELQTDGRRSCDVLPRSAGQRTCLRPWSAWA
jgi:hypothetical protein